MSDNFIEEQKNILLKEKSKLEKELQSFADKSGNNPEDYNTRFQDIGDSQDENAQEVSAYEKNLAIENNLEEVLHKINTALKRIDEGTYLQCQQGDTISKERLQVVPWADTCINHSK